MTNSPPPNPSPRREPLGFDDFVGILVAFLSIGAVLFWSLSQKDQGLDLSSFGFPASPSPSPTAPPALPSPVPSASGITVSPTAAPQPAASPLASASPQSPQPRTVPFIPLPVPVASASPTPTVSASPVTTGFADVPSDFWASPFIAVLAQRGIIEGFPDNTFKPNEPVTRAQFASMLQKAFNRDGTQRSLQFKDLPTGYWATSAIDQAVQTGFISGYPGNVVRPEQKISKVESIVSLVSGLALASPPTPEQTLGSYQDANQVPRYAVGKVAAATTAGLVVNHPDPKMLNPQQVTTRADAAALIYQALVKAGKADKISSPFVVQP
jgi:hypothetical protein